ncbi:MAG: glutathione S-transferase family protein [Granulosicoccus sp.]
MITLYDYELSGNCYKIRLLLSMLGVAYQKKTIEFYPAAAHRHDDFLSINPLGQLPVLQDDLLILRESHAILVYLASQYDKSGTWLPNSTPATLAQVTQWMCFADALTASASAARLADGFFHELDGDACRSEAHKLFRILDEHLWYNEREQLDWLVSGKHPTIADLACFTYSILCEEGGISRIDYPAIRRWTDRVKRLPGFIVMPGVFPAGPAIPSSDAEPVQPANSMQEESHSS